MIDIDKENSGVEEMSTSHSILFGLILHYISLTPITL